MVNLFLVCHYKLFYDCIALLRILHNVRFAQEKFFLLNIGLSLMKKFVLSASEIISHIFYGQFSERKSAFRQR